MIHHTLNRDVVSGQQARSPPKPGGERDIGTADRHKRIDNDLIKRTDEITSSIERGLGFGKRELGQCRRLRRRRGPERAVPPGRTWTCA